MALSNSPENPRNDVPPAAPFRHMVHDGIRGFKIIASEGVPGMRPVSRQPDVSKMQDSQVNDLGAGVSDSTPPAILTPADEVRAKLRRALCR